MSSPSAPKPPTPPPPPPPPSAIVASATPLSARDGQVRKSSKKRANRSALRLKRTSSNTATNSSSGGSGVNA